LDDHVANRKKEDYTGRKLEEEMYQAWQNLKHFAFRKVRRSVVTLCIWEMVNKLDRILGQPDSSVGGHLLRHLRGHSGGYGRTERHEEGRRDCGRASEEP
jgi:hypothetical protein